MEELIEQIARVRNTILELLASHSLTYDELQSRLDKTFDHNEFVFLFAIEELRYHKKISFYNNYFSLYQKGD